MSGGSYDYIYSKIDYELCGRMYDPEMNDMIEDLTKVCHDLEWWQSSDICEETYRETLRKFKLKWFKTPRTKRLKEYINKRTEEVRKELYQLIGEDIKDGEEEC